jgi:hypothetical protein
VVTAIFENHQEDDLPMSALAYATVATANHDAIVACCNAKYTHWMIQPAQLDNTIPTLFPNPPHPSYPAAHSCSSRSYAVTIGEFFPAHADAVSQAAEIADNSRIIAGIHFPADKRAGDEVETAVSLAVIDHARTLMP